MGYTTEFSGEITVSPPLNEQESAYLRNFATSRRMLRRKGPYYAEPGNSWGQDHSDDVLNYNEPAHGQPELWCQWVPTSDNTGIEWDGGEKFYSSAEWMAYLIDTFLKPGATVQQELLALQTQAREKRTLVVRDASSGWIYPQEFAAFTFNHLCNGSIDAAGENVDDRWRLVVRDNVVSVEQGAITYSDAVIVGQETAPTIHVSATRADRPHHDAQPAISRYQHALAGGVTEAEDIK